MYSARQPQSVGQPGNPYVSGESVAPCDQRLRTRFPTIARAREVSRTASTTLLTPRPVALASPKNLESRRDGRPILHVLQLRAGALDGPRDASNGSGHRGSRLADRGNRGAARMTDNPTHENKEACANCSNTDHVCRGCGYCRTCAGTCGTCGGCLRCEQPGNGIGWCANCD